MQNHQVAAAKDEPYARANSVSSGEDQELNKIDVIVAKDAAAPQKASGTSSSSSNSSKKLIAGAVLAVGAIAIVIAVVLITNKRRDSNADGKNGEAVDVAIETYNPSRVGHNAGIVTDSAQLTSSISSLRLVSLLPASGKISRRQAITVVFSKSVIALGSNFDSAVHTPPVSLICNGADVAFPSRWRWVTSSIARFDPTVDWPTDMSCTVKVNETLTSWDGLKLAPMENGETGTRSYTTQALSFRVSSVQSDSAEKLTDNVWDAFFDDGGRPEIPADGQVSLTFNTMVDPVKAAAAIRITGKKTSLAFVLNGSCTNPTGATPASRAFVNCIRGYISGGGLEVGDTTASLSVPSGSAIAQYGGPTSADASVKAAGRALFTLRFDKLSRPYEVSARKLRIYLHHGLSTDISTLAAAITITKSGSTTPLAATFTLTKSYEASMYVPALEVEASYTVNVAASAACRDGYGASLTASTGTFSTRKTNGELFDLTPQTCVVFPTSRAGDWGLFGRAKSFSAYECPITMTYDAIPASDLANVVSAAVNYGYTNSYRWPWTSGKSVLSPPASKTFTSVASTVPALLKSTTAKIASREYMSSCRTYGMNLIQGSDKVLTVFLTPDHVDVLVTDLFDSSPVANATVNIYRRSSTTSQGSAVSNAEGLARLAAPGDSQSYTSYIVVASLPDGSYAITRNLQVRHSSKDLRGTATTDRGVYNLLETVTVKGYVREKHSATGALSMIPAGTKVTANIRWAEGVEEEVAATTNEFGAFTATVAVPATADYGKVYIRFGREMYRTFATASIVVADPRIPSAQLSLKVNSDVLLTSASTIPVTVAASTYSGQPLGGTSVTVKLEVRENDPSRPTLEHTTTVALNNQGTATLSLALADADVARLTPSMSVVVTASCVSPTRETLVKTVSKTPQDALVKIHAAKVHSNERVIPGVATSFEVKVDTNEDKGVASPAPASRRITVGVYPTSLKKAISAPCAYCSAWQYLRTPENVAPVVTTTCDVALDSDNTNLYVGVCAVTVPTMGTFEVAFTTADSASNSITSPVSGGENAEQWQAMPLTQLSPITAQLENQGTIPANTAFKVDLVNPHAFAARVALVCANGQQAPITSAVAASPVKTSVTLPSSWCGCAQIVATVLTPELTPAQLQASLSSVTVPTSAGTDLAAPSHFDYVMTPTCAKGASEEITATVTGLPTSTTPGSAVSATVNVVNADTKAPTAAEVTLYVVDKSNLDLQRPSDANLDASTPQYTSWAKDDQRDDYVSAAYVQKMQARVPAISLLNPWLYEGSLKGTNVNQNASDFALSFTSDLMRFPYVWTPSPWMQNFYGTDTFRGGEESMMMDGAMAGGAIPVPVMASSAGAAESASVARDASATVTTTTADKETSDNLKTASGATAVIMKVTTDATTGTAPLQFTLPSGRVGTWEVRVLAVTATATASKSPLTEQKAEIVTKKPLQAVASCPRVVRFGDTFHAGVVISTFEGAADVTVTVDMAGHRGLTLTGNSMTKSVNVVPATPLEVTFPFSAAGSDKNGVLRFTVSSAAHSDTVQVAVPVTGVLSPVSVGTSFSLLGNSQWNEGLVYPSSVPHSGKVDITTSIGRLAAIESEAQAVLDRFDNPRQWETYASDWLDVIASFAALFPYAASNAPMSDATIASATLGGSDSVFAGIKVKFPIAVSQLQLYTSSSHGLRMTQRMPSYPWVDYSLNLRALHVFRHVLPSLASIPAVYSAGKLDALRSHWESAVVSYIREYTSYPNAKPSTWLSASLYFAADATLDSRVATMAAIVPWSTLVSSRCSSCGALSKAQVFVKLARDKSDLAAIADLRQGYLNNIRVTGRTAYVASSSGGYAPSDAVSALILDGFTRGIGMAQQVVLDTQMHSKLANYISQSADASDLQFISYYRAGGSGDRMLALSGYDTAVSATNPDLVVTTHNGSLTSTPLYTVPFRGAEALRNTDARSYAFEQLTASNATGSVSSSLTFASEGSGEASVVLALNFEPRLPAVNAPRYFGIYVEKNLVAVTGASAGQSAFLGRPDGAPLQLAPGDIVKVTISVTTPDDLSSVQITDLVPGGLEPVDSALDGNADLLRDAQAASNAMSSAGRSGMASPSGVSYDWSWWRWFFGFKVETMSDRVMCTGYSPRAGTYECSYFATATTSGSFVIPSAEGHAMNQPEVFGTSKYAHVDVAQRGQ